MSDTFDSVPTLGERVALARTEKEWTQGELARHVRRVNPSLRTRGSTISSIETNESQKPTILNELAIALGVTETWLRTGRGPKTPDHITIPEMSIVLDHIRETMRGAFEAIDGVSPEDALALSQLVIECAQEPPVPGQVPDAQHRRMLSAFLTRRFFQAKTTQKSDA